MTAVLWSLGLTALALLTAFWFARRSGRDQALREIAERSRKNDKEAAKVIAEHRTVDDTAKRLSDGKF